MVKSATKRADKQKSNTPTPEQMSVAELLGGDAAAQAPVTKVGKERDSNEPNSGLLKVAEIIEKASTEPDERASAASLVTGQFPVETVREDTAPVATAPAPTTPPKSIGPYIVIAILVVALAGVIYYMQTSKPAAPQLPTQVAVGSDTPTSVKPTPEVVDKAPKAPVVKEQPTEPAPVPSAPATNDTPEPAKPEPGEPKASEAKTASAKPRIPAPAKAATSPAKETKATATPTKTKSKAPTQPKTRAAATKAPAKKAAAVNGNAKELDVLLGSSKKAPTAASKTPKEDTSKPRQLSKQAIKKAMSPAAKKAQSCARFATGTVKVKVTVAGSGKVKSATPTGSFASHNAGKCVSMMVRMAKFPAFDAPSQTFTYPVILK